MGKFRGFTGRTAAVTLAMAMIFQGTALAAPADELQEILEKQEERDSGSLLEETLGLSELGEAIAGKGLNVQIQSGLAAGTAEAMDLSGEIPEEGYASLGLQIDPVEKAWSFAVGAGEGENSVLDLILYGDQEQFAVAVPQFFTGALALSAGNLKEQYENSALAGILGGAENIPDIDLSFYPGDDSMDEAAGLFDGMKQKIQEKAEEMEKDLQVEKTEDGDTVIYTATVKTEDIIDLYSIILKEYISFFDNLGMVVSADDQAVYENAVEEMLEQFDAVLGDEIAVDFLTEEELLKEIRLEMYYDSSLLRDSQEIMTEIVEEELAPAGNAEDAVGAEDDVEAETKPEDWVSLTVAGDTEETAAEEAEDIAVAETEIMPENWVSLTVAEDASDVTGSDSDTEDGWSADGSTVVAEGADGPTVVTDPVVIGGADGSTDISIEAAEFQGYISYDIVFHNPGDAGEGFSVDMRMRDMDDEEIGTFYMDWSRRDEGTSQTYTYSIDVTEDGETVYSDTPFTASFDAETGDLDAALVMDTVNDDGYSHVAVKLDSTFSQIEKGKGFVWTIDGLGLEGDEAYGGVTAEIAVSADPGELLKPEPIKDILKMTEEELQELVQEIQIKFLGWSAQFAPEEETETDLAM